MQPLYKHLMGWPITLKDITHIDEQIYRNLVELLDFDDVSILYLEFVVTEDHLGVPVTVPLVKGGADMAVDNSNLPDYLIAQLQYRLMNRVNEQLKEFLKGFYDVVPETLLSVFDFQEVELLLHGLPNIDMDDWLRHTEYTGEFFGNSGTYTYSLTHLLTHSLTHSLVGHKVVLWFWEIIKGYEQEQKAKLLQFVTGTSGVPVQGFSALQGNDGNIRKFCLHGMRSLLPTHSPTHSLTHSLVIGDKNVKVFPRAHTCFNRIDMPIYKSKGEMQKYLTLAINMESTGFDME